jgi:hypothetical protein
MLSISPVRPHERFISLVSKRSGVLSGQVYRSCMGCGAPHHNGGVHDRVRASFPQQQQQQPRRGVLILERERRRPNGTKSACLRALKGRGREGATCGGVSARLHLPTGVHLPESSFHAVDEIGRYSQLLQHLRLFSVSVATSQDAVQCRGGSLLTRRISRTLRI